MTNQNRRPSKMEQMRRNSAAVKEYVYSSKPILYIFDCALSLLVLPFLSTAFWVSVDYIYLYQTADIRVALAILCFSALLYVVLHTASKSIYRFVVAFAGQSKARFHVAAKAYVYVSAVSGVVVFDGFDTLSENVEWAANIWVNVAMVVFGFGALFCMKCYVHLAGFGNDVDQESTPEEVFLFPYRIFECSWKKNKLLYLLDSVFSVFIVGFLVILVWKGAWSILNGVIIPSDQLQSAWASLGIGYALVILTCILQPLLKKFLSKYDGWKRISALDTYIVFSFCGSINVWRGIWMLLEKYGDLSNSLPTCLALHFGSFFILVIFNATNTLLVRGVYIDADGSGGECLDFPCYYFRFRFHAKPKERNHEELDELNAAQKIQVLSNHDDEKYVNSWPSDANESIELTSDIHEKSNSPSSLENQENEVDSKDDSTSRSNKTHLEPHCVSFSS